MPHLPHGGTIEAARVHVSSTSSGTAFEIGAPSDFPLPLPSIASILCRSTFQLPASQLAPFRLQLTIPHRFMIRFLALRLSVEASTKNVAEG
jgi:hypothetical protein